MGAGGPTFNADGTGWRGSEDVQSDGCSWSESFDWTDNGDGTLFLACPGCTYTRNCFFGDYTTVDTAVVPREYSSAFDPGANWAYTCSGNQLILEGDPFVRRE